MEPVSGRLANGDHDCDPFLVSLNPHCVVPLKRYPSPLLWDIPIERWYGNEVMPHRAWTQHVGVSALTFEVQDRAVREPVGTWKRLHSVRPQSPLCCVAIHIPLMKTSAQHIFRSHWSDVHIPKTLLTSFIFDCVTDADHGFGKKQAFVDATNPSHWYTFSQFKQIAHQVRVHLSLHLASSRRREFESLLLSSGRGCSSSLPPLDALFANSHVDCGL